MVEEVRYSTAFSEEGPNEKEESNHVVVHKYRDSKRPLETHYLGKREWSFGSGGLLVVTTVDKLYGIPLTFIEEGICYI